MTRHLQLKHTFKEAHREFCGQHSTHQIAYWRFTATHVYVKLSGVRFQGTERPPAGTPLASRIYKPPNYNLWSRPGVTVRVPFLLQAGALCCLWTQSLTWRSSGQAWVPPRPAGPEGSSENLEIWVKSAQLPPSLLCWPRPRPSQWVSGWRGIWGSQGCSVHSVHLKEVGDTTA